MNFEYLGILIRNKLVRGILESIFASAVGKSLVLVQRAPVNRSIKKRLELLLKFERSFNASALEYA